MPLSSLFCAALKERRKAAGLTQERLAEQAGFSPIYISKLESGTRRPSMSAAHRLAAALGLEQNAKEHFLKLVSNVPGQFYNLPPLLTPCLGRETQLAEAEQLLLSPSVRLLTIKGAAGVGKTRMALELATSLGDNFPDGVIFIDLAAARSSEEALATMARAKGVGALSSHHTVPSTLDEGMHHLVKALKSRHMLLVLDNVEQVVGAGLQFIRLLSECPTLNILVTSRSELQVCGEYIFRLPPLVLPNLQESLSLEAARQSPAIALFEQRACEVNPSFSLTVDNVSDIAAICAALCGFPLAIRLAAVRLSTLTPQALRKRLAQPLEVLTSGPRDLPARQQSLVAALDWSYALLMPAERTLFQCLCRLNGTFTLADIEAVITQAQAVGTTRPWFDLSFLDALAALVTHSLVERVDDGSGEPSYAMFAFIKDYAASKRSEHVVCQLEPRHMVS